MEERSARPSALALILLDLYERIAEFRQEGDVLVCGADGVRKVLLGAVAEERGKLPPQAERETCAFRGLAEEGGDDAVVALGGTLADGLHSAFADGLTHVPQGLGPRHALLQRFAEERELRRVVN